MDREPICPAFAAPMLPDTGLKSISGGGLLRVLLLAAILFFGNGFPPGVGALHAGSADDDAERMEQAAARALASLEGKLAPRMLSPDERKVLQKARTVSFDPFPTSPHRVYIDRIEDFRERRVLRTRFDYAGNAISTSEPAVERSVIESYLLALAYEVLGAERPMGLPAVVDDVR